MSGPGSPVAAEDESDRAGEGQGTSADLAENSMGLRDRLRQTGTGSHPKYALSTTAGVRGRMR